MHDMSKSQGQNFYLVPHVPRIYGEYWWEKMPSCPTFSEQIRRIFVGQDAILSHVFRADTANICGTRCHLVPRFPSRYGEYLWDKMPSCPTFSEKIRRIFVGQDAILSHVFRADTANICGTRCHLVPRFPSRYGEYSWDKMPSCPTFSEQIRRIFVGQDAILSHVFRADTANICGTRCHLVPRFPRRYGEYSWDKMPSCPTFSEQIRRIFVGQDAILSHVFRADTANIRGTRCHLVPRFPSRYGEYLWDKMPSCPTFSEQIRRIFVGQDAILSHVFREDTANIRGTRCHLVPRFPSRYGEYLWDKMPSCPTFSEQIRRIFVGQDAILSHVFRADTANICGTRCHLVPRFPSRYGEYSWDKMPSCPTFSEQIRRIFVGQDAILSHVFRADT